MQLAASTIIQDARDLHPRFNRERHDDRLLLSQLSELQIFLIRQIAKHMRDRLSMSRQVAAVVDSSLVGTGADGISYVFATTADGFGVLVGADGVAYMGADLLSADPIADGFILPSDMMEMLAIHAVVPTNRSVPVTWLPQHDKAQYSGHPGLRATVNGWRLLPLKNPTQLNTRWDDVISVTVDYVTEPARLTTADDILTVPVDFQYVLKYELAVFMARRIEEEGGEFAHLGAFMQERDKREAIAMENAKLDHTKIKHRRIKPNR